MAGIVGVYSPNNPVQQAYKALLEIQHRGQQNWGLAAGNNHSLCVYKGEGPITDVLFEDVKNAFDHLTVHAVIGHVGDKKVKTCDIAPINLKFTDGCEIAVAMSGSIFNRDSLSMKYGFLANSDEELFGHLFHKNLKGRNIEEAALKTMNELDIGTYYSLTALIQRDNESNLVAMRDKRGVKPMYMRMRRDESSVLIGSESYAVKSALQMTKGYGDIDRDILPGELIIAGPDGIIEKQLVNPEPKHCVLEWICKSGPEAMIDGQPAGDARKKAGKLNAELHDLKDDGKSVIISIPDYGKLVALGAAEGSGIPFEEYALIKSRRPPSEEEEKYIVLELDNDFALFDRKAINGKHVIIGYDSIVQTTMLQKHVRSLRRGGVDSVSILVGYAPRFYQCFSEPANLACKGMLNKSHNEIERKVAENLKVINNVYYNSVENVIKAVGLPEESLCTYCITGKNPFSDCSV